MTRRKDDGKGGKTKRPDPLTDLQRAILAEGKRRVTVRDGGAPVEMSVNEIIAWKSAETAAKGSPHAQRTWLTANAEAAAREAEIKEENATFWHEYRLAWLHAIAEAKKGGLPLPEPVPHPDDIRIDARNNVSIDGPVTPEEASVLAYITSQRDAFLRRHVLDDRRAKRKAPAKTDEGVGSALVMASMADSVLPKRLQFGETGMWRLYWYYRGQTARALLKDDYRAWKKLRLPTARGTASPDLQDFARLIPALATIAVELGESAGADRDVDRALAQVVALVGRAAKGG